MPTSKVITLYGKPRCGKTTTIRIVRDALMRKHHVQIVYKHPRLSKEVCQVIQIRTTRIGILSIGDTQKVMEEKFRKILEYDCSIIICATREEGTETWNLVKVAHEVKYYSIERVAKSCTEMEEDEDRLNQRDARRILGNVNGYIWAVE